MALKKRAKVSAEFSMSSLTDIIFLLLIFFMLTSNTVNVKVFELPESEIKTVAPVSVIVSIEKDGTVEVDRQATTFAKLEIPLKDGILAAREKNPKEVLVTIVAEKGTEFSQVMKVMKIAAKYKADALIATQAKYQKKAKK